MAASSTFVTSLAHIYHSIEVFGKGADKKSNKLHSEPTPCGIQKAFQPRSKGLSSFSGGRQVTRPWEQGSVKAFRIGLPLSLSS